jgi:YVTN family beta-propeller protein
MEKARSRFDASLPAGPCPSRTQNAYITNVGSSTVSVIDTATNTVSATIPVGGLPNAVAVTPDGSKVYIANVNSRNVQVIDMASNTVIATRESGGEPFTVAVDPRRQQGLCRQWNIQHSIRERHRDEHGHCHDPRRLPTRCFWHFYTAGAQVRQRTWVKQLSGHERLGSGDKVWWPRCRGCILGVLHHAGTAGCHSAFCGG